MWCKRFVKTCALIKVQRIGTSEQKHHRTTGAQCSGGDLPFVKHGCSVGLVRVTWMCTLKCTQHPRKGEACFRWYSHSAVFRDPAYSGWTPWLAAQEEAEDTVGALSCGRQTIVHSRQWCQNVSLFTTRAAQSRRYCGNNIRPFGSAADWFFCFFFLVCLDANWEGWLTEEESKPSFKWCSTSLLNVSWIFGTLYCKGKSFLCSQILVHTAFLIKMLL